MNPVDAYKKAIAERAAAAREQRKQESPMPNLAHLEEQFDPRKDAPINLGQAAKVQAITNSKEDKATFSEATIAGLAALKKEMEKQRAMQEQKKKEPEAPKEQPKAQEQPKEDTTLPPQRLFDDIDALEFEHRLDRIQQDVINNKEEKAAVEKRLEEEGSEISIEEMLRTGTVTQTVPITDKLRVKYRSISPAENRSIRLLLWRMIEKDPRLADLASDLYGMMLIVAAVVQINDERFPNHWVGSSFHTAEFDDEVFLSKFNLMSRYPAPLIHAIGVHANWFDERVRKTFTTANIKDF